MEEKNFEGLHGVTKEQLKSIYPNEFAAIKWKIRIGKICWILSIFFTVYLLLLMFFDPDIFLNTMIAAMCIYILLPVGIVKHIKGSIRMHHLRKRAIEEGKV